MTGARSHGIDLVHAATLGAGEFERRLRETERVVYQVAYGILRSDVDAEDVCQDVFLRAYRKLGGLRDAGKFRAWVLRMSRRLALNHNRSATRAQRRDAVWFQNTVRTAASAETEAAGRDFQARLRDEIDCLPETMRSVLLLSAIYGLDTRDVANVLGIPEGTVRSRLHSARKQLLQRFVP